MNAEVPARIYAAVAADLRFDPALDADSAPVWVELTVPGDPGYAHLAGDEERGGAS